MNLPYLLVHFEPIENTPTWHISLCLDLLQDTNDMQGSNLFPNLNVEISPRFSESGDALSLDVNILIEHVMVLKGKILVSLTLREGSVERNLSLANFRKGVSRKCQLAATMEMLFPLWMIIAIWNCKPGTF